MPESPTACSAPIIINEERIEKVLKTAGSPDSSRIREILAKSRELKGLPMEDVEPATHSYGRL